VLGFINPELFRIWITTSGSGHAKYQRRRDFPPNLTCLLALDRQYRYRNHRSKREAAHAGVTDALLRTAILAAKTAL
jgi:hypothetical protein